MKKNTKIISRFTFLLTITILILSSILINVNANDNYLELLNRNIVKFDNSEGSISVTIPIGEFEIKRTDQGHEISVENLGQLLVPGKPDLPSKIFAIAIPPGAYINEITFNTGEIITLIGTYDIPPIPLPRVIGQENPKIFDKERELYEKNYYETYESNNPYPKSVGELVRTAGFRKYNLVDVRITPFTYLPSSGKLIYYPEVTVNIKYSFSNDFSFKNIILDDLTQTETTADDIIVNYNYAKTWYPKSKTNRDNYDYVIITIDSLTSSITSLIDWETYKGRSVKVVTTSWIDENYEGWDLAEKIRNFLIEKYPSEQWGILDVCLIGHYDDVPMRRTYQSVGYGYPETDYYYAELSLPDEESWDADGDHRYGENSDPIDFYTEVNVGRIPWSDPLTVEHICEKSITYEDNDDPSFKKNILLLGAFFWDNDPNARTDNAVLMEYKVNSDMHPWMTVWNMTRMYEEGHSTYAMDYDLRNSNVDSVWSSGKFAFVNWAGHGSPYSSHRYHGGEAFISTDNCLNLNDDYPAIIFADACSNSDTDKLNIGQAMLKQGGVGFLGATKVAFGRPGWSHPNQGSTQSLDYFFTTFVTSGDYSQGESHQRALREMYTRGLWSQVKYEMFEWGALWGNPNLRLSSIGDIEISETKGGFGFSALIKNNCEDDFNDVNWSMKIESEIILLGSEKSGKINIPAEGEVKIKSGLVFGWGETIISTIIHGEAGKISTGFMFGPFLLNVN